MFKTETQTETLCGQLKMYETGMLITHVQPSGWHARPMALAQVDGRGDVWFITGEDSAKIREIEADASVLVVCQDGWTSCVTVEGRAELVRDHLQIRAVWKPGFKIWFPQGADDPNIVLIHVIAEHAEYWDNTGMNHFTYLYESLKALAHDTTPTVKEGEQHGQIILKQKTQERQRTI